MVDEVFYISNILLSTVDRMLQVSKSLAEYNVFQQTLFSHAVLSVKMTSMLKLAFMVAESNGSYHQTWKTGEHNVLY